MEVACFWNHQKSALELETSTSSVAFSSNGWLLEDKTGFVVFYVSETLVEGKVENWEQTQSQRELYGKKNHGKGIIIKVESKREMVGIDV